MTNTDAYPGIRHSSQTGPRHCDRTVHLISLKCVDATHRIGTHKGAIGVLDYVVGLVEQQGYLTYREVLERILQTKEHQTMR